MSPSTFRLLVGWREREEKKKKSENKGGQNWTRRKEEGKKRGRKEKRKDKEVLFPPSVWLKREKADQHKDVIVNT